MSTQEMVLQVAGATAAATHGRKRHLVRNTFFNLAGQLLPLLVGVVAIPVLVRDLGTDRFGVLGIVWVVFGYFNLFDFGLGRATTKILAELLESGEAERVSSVVWTSVIMQIGLGIFGGVLMQALIPLLTEHMLRVPPALMSETKLSLSIIAAALPVILVLNGLRAVLEGCQRFDISNLLKLPGSTLVFALPLLGAWLGYHLPGIIFLLVLSRVVLCAAHLWYCLRIVPGLRDRFQFRSAEVRALVRFGGWVTLGNFLNPIMLYIDRFLIGSMVSLAFVSYYTAPFEAVTKLWLIPAALGSTLLPACSAIGHNGKTQLRDIYGRSFKALLLILGPVAVILFVFAHELLRLWLGPAFAATSTLPFQILVIGVFINCFSHIPYNYLQGLGRPEIAARLFMIELPIYGVIAWVMILKFGIIGAALAWALRATLESAAMVLITWRVFSILPTTRKRAEIARSVAVLALLLGCVAGIGYRLSSSVWIQIFLLCLVSSGYLAGVWAWILDDVEKDSLLKLLPTGRALVTAE